MHKSEKRLNVLSNAHDANIYRLFRSRFNSKTEVKKVLSISIVGIIVNSSLNNTSKLENCVIFQAASHGHYFKRMQFVSFSFPPALRTVLKDLEKGVSRGGEWRKEALNAEASPSCLRYTP